ncbi:AmmeMemoRadiSam system radical SAM enzyme [Irregularibacter muris]|uniref:AmmeMemoRadiSam system radical SAM enzyme n=1 Tax=Irregularibacter muris TaxID=1796619 RepID=A0AAE3HG97_9FIRM|nr:AmmeMemoRadiSam system radical SAM enzyme [Irregularibacter muris]MCR1898558.1 AmmeMemoRadiSam system radical SAM enzyme [Irregularibacter muris]
MREAMFYEKKEDYIHCYLCPHHCQIKEGNRGRCNVRKVIDGKLYSLNYGEVSAMYVDPIEKKPLRDWMPGSEVLSFGSFGCNFHCQFCQNHNISMERPMTMPTTPGEIVDRTLEYKVPSIAYTYNEPTIFYEMMWDVARLAKKNNLKNVLITNGYIEKEALIHLLQSIDAMNIDLKTYSDDIYKKMGGHSVSNILHTIEEASQKCHVEISLLIVPGINDDLKQIQALFDRLREINSDLVLHISRYFPIYHYHEDPTDIDLMKRIQEKALTYFEKVYLENV